jgi:hypothetical protein
MDTIGLHPPLYKLKKNSDTSGKDLVKSSCEHGDDLPESIKMQKNLDQLNDYKLLEKNSQFCSE